MRHARLGIGARFELVVNLEQTVGWSKWMIKMTHYLFIHSLNHFYR